MVSASPEPPSVIPAEWPAEPTAGASSERKCARELASIHHEASSLGSDNDYLGSDCVSRYCPSSWFAAVFASAVIAMVIDHYVNQIN
jgi:hypothetical protein